MTLDPDFGWRLRSGWHFRENGITMTEPFTYTASDFPWVNHAAVSDVILSFVYDFGDGLGLNGFVLVAILYAGIYTLAFFIIWRAALVKNPKISPWLLLCGAVAMLPFIRVGAITFSVLLLAALIWLLAKPLNQPSWRRILIPLLFMTWGNLHGSFMVGLGYFGYKIFYEALFSDGVVFVKGRVLSITRRLVEMRWIIGLLVLSALATLVNFYGYHVYREILMTLGDSSLSGTIAEWQPGMPTTMVPIMILFILGYGLLAQQDAPGGKWQWVKRIMSVENIFFLAAVSSVRHWPLFILVAFGPMTDRLDLGLAPYRKQLKNNQKLRRFMNGVWIGIATLTVGLGIINTAPQSARFSARPSEIVAYIRNVPCEGNIFNTYNIGGYLIWQLPEYPIYIDGRMPSWVHNGRNYMADYLRVYKDREFRRGEFERHNIRCAILNEDDKIVRELESEGWQMVMRDDGFVLLRAPR